jgi:hypothetical protein
MAKKLEVKIDITDWGEEYQDKALDVSSEDEIIERAKEGVKPSEMSRLTIAARELGCVPEDVLRPNKILLMIGGAVSVSNMIARRVKESSLSNGKSVKMRELTCATEGVEKQVVVDASSETGFQNAVNYLLNVVPGYIYSRLVIIADHGGDVQEYANQLKALIDDMVSKLV